VRLPEVPWLSSTLTLNFLRESGLIFLLNF
jgi:hypothetical protein